MARKHTLVDENTQGARLSVRNVCTCGSYSRLFHWNRKSARKVFEMCDAGIVLHSLETCRGRGVCSFAIEFCYDDGEQIHMQRYHKNGKDHTRKIKLEDGSSNYLLFS